MGGQASTSTSTLTSPAITQDQLAAALAAATGGGAAGMVKGHWIRYHFLLFEKKTVSRARKPKDQLGVKKSVSSIRITI